jgi:hypothetical protein
VTIKARWNAPATEEVIHPVTPNPAQAADQAITGDLLQQKAIRQAGLIRLQEGAVLHHAAIQHQAKAQGVILHQAGGPAVAHAATSPLPQGATVVHPAGAQEDIQEAQAVHVRTADQDLQAAQGLPAAADHPVAEEDDKTS